MLVPEGHTEATTEGASDIIPARPNKRRAIDRFTDAGIISSVFIDAEIDQIEAAARIGKVLRNYTHWPSRPCTFHNKDAIRRVRLCWRELEDSSCRRSNQARHAVHRRSRAELHFNAAGMRVWSIQTAGGNIGHAAIISRAVFVGLLKQRNEVADARGAVFG